MKLLSNSKKVILGSEKIAISSHVYTRDFKSYPMIAIIDEKASDLTHYKNPTIFTPTITTKNLGSLKYTTYTVSEESENSIVSQDVKFTSYTDFTFKSRYRTYYNGDSLSYDGGSMASHTSTITKNFIYGSGYYNSNSDLPLVEGIGILNRSLNDICLYTNSPNFSSKSYGWTKGGYWTIIDTDDNRDLVILDLYVGAGESNSNTIFKTLPSGVDYRSFGLTSNCFANDVFIFSIKTDSTLSMFTKTNVVGASWDSTASSATAYRLNSCPSNAIKNDDGTWTVYILRSTKATSSTKLGLWKLIINEKDLTCSIYQVSDNLPDIFYEYIATTVYNDIEKCSRYYQIRYYRKQDGKAIVSVVLTNSTSSSNIGIFSYLVDEEQNTAEFVERYTPQLPGFMDFYMINNTLMLCGSAYGYELLSLNVETASWSKVGGRELSMQAIVYDDISNALFYKDTSDYLYMDKLDVATTADWGWDNENLEWTGSEIETSIHISCYNILSELCKQKVKLTITGNAVFTQNNQSTISITTSDTDVTTVPITITGDGIVTVSAQSAISLK